MSDIVVPPLGESVSEATVAKWFKKAGEAVKKDELLVELETDKVTLEVNALQGGVLKEIKSQVGDSVKVGAVLGVIDEGGAATSEAKPAPSPKAASPAAAPPSAPALPKTVASDRLAASGPAVRKMADEGGIKPSGEGSGKDGRFTKADIVQAAVSPSVNALGDREERVKMSKLRQVIAKRLKDSQNTAAILTTFNEIDMTNVMEFRNEYKDVFEKKHGVKLGFMGFFVKAAVQALKEIPAVNAEIDNDEIVYKNYYDIGVAVGTEQGLVVPVVRNADQLSLAGVEQEIGNLAKKARDGKLAMSELQGGTFTITNGGVYGSLLSTPIINPPQSGILGMHKTMERPMVMKDGSIKARAMMYIALSYDHRIIDGREAVTFLVRVKEAVEDPKRLLLAV